MEFLLYLHDENTLQVQSQTLEPDPQCPRTREVSSAYPKAALRHLPRSDTVLIDLATVSVRLRTSIPRRGLSLSIKSTCGRRSAWERMTGGVWYDSGRHGFEQCLVLMYRNNNRKTNCKITNVGEFPTRSLAIKFSMCKTNVWRVNSPAVRCLPRHLKPVFGQLTLLPIS